MHTKTIGIVGGMGPFAGVDVHKKIYENTIARQDDEHFDVVCLSFAQDIPDRTDFLLGKSTANPGPVVAQKISAYPIDILGVACNTFHGAPIFDAFTDKLKESNPDLNLLHLPQEVLRAVQEGYHQAKIGVLCTVGTYGTGLYQEALKNVPVDLVFPSAAGRAAIQQVITNPEWGIKQHAALTATAREVLEQEVEALGKLDAVLLACTELPLIVNAMDWGCAVLDTNRILARALIREADATRLK